MSVYHEFNITVESVHRGLQDGTLLKISKDGDGGLAIEMPADHLRNRQEWQEVRDALMLAGQQLGWH